MGVIKIDDQYCIKVDEYNYTLSKIRVGKSGKKEGKEYYESVGHYSSVVQALEAYGRENARDVLINGSMTLPEALTAIGESWEMVARTIRESIPRYAVVEVE